MENPKADILLFTEKFLELESKKKLFDLSENGTLYWDLVRYHVFFDIYFNLCGIKLNVKKSSISKKKFRFLKKSCDIFQFYYSFLFKKKKYLFFTASRNINQEGYTYDINSNEMIALVQEKSLIIETCPPGNEKPSYDSIFNYGLTIEYYFKNFIQSILPRKKCEKKYEISTTLKEEFNVDIDFDALINTHIENFKIDYKYYIKLFKKLNPTAIFMIQNGVQKGMFAAANSLAIPIVEIQHGLIGYYHPSYSYPKSVAKNQLNTLPKFFFSYADFWTKSLNYPVEKSISVGNSNIARKVNKLEPSYEITVLYSDGYDKHLIKIIEELISLGFIKRMCVKLHPSLFSRYSEIAQYFSSYTFIDVIKNEISVENLFSITKTVLAIQSTSVYQALYNEVPVLLYKKLDYQIHADVFDNPLLIIVESANDIKNFLDKEKKINSINKPYFQDFNPSYFLNFLNSLE